jgi:uncharacterized membrane protein (UPF0136 family)
LSFQNVQPGDVGAILDNVSVLSSVPEPGSLTLACLAVLGGFVGYARRRNRVALR